MAALLTPQPQANIQAQLESRLAGTNLKSPSAGGGAGFSGSPVGQYLNPDSAFDANGSTGNRSRLRQNRISAPGTLIPSERWQGSLDQVIERGPSPGAESATSSRSKSPGPDMRPKSTAFDSHGRETQSPALNTTSPRVSQHNPVPMGSFDALSPVPNGSWASMTSTPLVPMFTDPKIDNMASALSAANAQLNQLNQLGRAKLDDARGMRRPVGSTTTSRNVSGASYQEDSFPRSPVLDHLALSGLGLGDPAMAGLGVNFAQLGLNPLATAQAAQMLALAQSQQLGAAGSFNQAGYGGMRSGRVPVGRRSPNLKSHSPAPREGGGGVGGGAGVGGPDDVDIRVLEDTLGWLRVLRLHKYNTNFERDKWRSMAMMTDQDLQDKGVSAQGARTKVRTVATTLADSQLLKVFWNVRTKTGMEHPAGNEEYPGGGVAVKEERD